MPATEMILSYCVRAWGRHYVVLRDALLASAPAADLERIAGNGPSPVARVASAALLWRRDPATCHRIDALMRGHFRLGRGTPLGGTYSSWHRANAIAALGARVVPRVAELLLHERSWHPGAELESLATALWLLEGDLGRAALIEPLAAGDDPELQLVCADTAGRAHLAAAAPLLLLRAVDAHADVRVRAAAVRALAVLRDANALPALRALFADEGLHPAVRAECVFALKAYAEAPPR